MDMKKSLDANGIVEQAPALRQAAGHFVPEEIVKT
jgi:hypothetical protein